MVSEGKKGVGVNEIILKRLKQKQLDYDARTLEDTVRILLDHDDKNKRK
jgi:hypothetical protein